MTVNVIDRRDLPVARIPQKSWYCCIDRSTLQAYACQNFWIDSKGLWKTLVAAVCKGGVPQIPGLAGAPRNFTVRGPQSLQSYFSLVPTGAARPPPRRSRLPQLYLCPLAKRVWDWVIKVWEEVSGQPVPDLGPCELLQGRGGPFRPQPDLKGLWVQLRLAIMSAIHSCASQRRTGRPASAHTAAAYIVHHLRTPIVRDWRRVSVGGKDPLADLSTGVCCTSWLRGRHPALQLSQFISRWGPSGRLCAVQTSRGRHSVAIVFSLTHPVRFPAVSG